MPLANEEPTKLLWFVFISKCIPRDKALILPLCCTIHETYFAKSLTERFSFNCGQVILKNILLHRKENKITKLCISEVILERICSCLSLPVVRQQNFWFLTNLVLQPLVSVTLLEWRWMFRCCRDQHAAQNQFIHNRVLLVSMPKHGQNQHSIT